MSFTTAELNVVNQALGRIGATNISSAENGSTTCNNYVQANIHYSQTRDSLLRSFEWPFCAARAELRMIKTLTLDSEPLPSAWAAGDVITGISSYETATILTVTSNTEYEIIYLSGDFTDGETLTDADVEQVYWEGRPLEYEEETLLWFDDSASNQVVCGTGYPVVDEIVPDFGWDYQYELPADFVRLKAVYEDDGEDTPSRRYVIEGTRFLTNYDSARILYIKKITDLSDFDYLFIEVLILALALKLLSPLAGTQTAAFRETLQKEYADARSRARTVCSQEVNVTGYSGWNLARFGTTTSGTVTAEESSY